MRKRRENIKTRVKWINNVDEKPDLSMHPVNRRANKQLPVFDFPGVCASKINTQK